MTRGVAAKATLCLLNEERTSRGLVALRENFKQEKAAAEHNRLMVRSSCFSHVCPGEKDLLGRVTAAGYLPCSCTWLVGENIAWGSGQVGSTRSIVSAWMNSPSHRANILNPKFDEIGIAFDRGNPAGGADAAATYTTVFGFKS